MSGLNSFVDLCYCTIDLISYFEILNCLLGIPCGCVTATCLHALVAEFQPLHTLSSVPLAEIPYRVTILSWQCQAWHRFPEDFGFCHQTKIYFFSSGCKTACSHRGKHTLKLCHLGSQIPFHSIVTWRSALFFSCCPIAWCASSPSGEHWTSQCLTASLSGLNNKKHLVDLKTCLRRSFKSVKVQKHI